MHDLHADCPLAPENAKVSVSIVSDFSKGIYSHYHEGKSVKEENVCFKIILTVRLKDFFQLQG